MKYPVFVLEIDRGGNLSLKYVFYIWLYRGDIFFYLYIVGVYRRTCRKRFHKNQLTTLTLTLKFRSH